MDFENAFRADLDKKYAQMLDMSTPLPYKKRPQIDSHDLYQMHNAEYHDRLEAERSEFNNAHKTICSKRAGHEIKRLKKAQVIKTLISFIPVFLSIIIGYDVFSESHGHTAKVAGIDSISMDFVLAAFIIYCLFVLIYALILSARLKSKYEKAVSYLGNCQSCGTPADKQILSKARRACNVGVLIVLIISTVIISANIVGVVSSINQDKLIYIVGDTRSFKYVEKNTLEHLPESYSVEEEKEDGYIVKHTLVAWNVDGKDLAPGVTYDPHGRQEIKAVFGESEWCRFEIKTDSRAADVLSSLSVTYNGNEYWGKEQTYMVPRNTNVVVSADAELVTFLNGKYKFIIGGTQVRELPYIFEIDTNTVMDVFPK